MAMKKCPNCNNSTMNFMKKCPTCGTALDDSCVVGFGEALFSQAESIRAEKADQSSTKRIAVLDERERVKQMDKDGVAYCPKCHSTSLSAHKKGFGVGKAIVGATFAPIGIAAGAIGANKVRVTCLKCGHQFWAGKR